MHSIDVPSGRGKKTAAEQKGTWQASKISSRTTRFVREVQKSRKAPGRDSSEVEAFTKLSKYSLKVNDKVTLSTDFA